MSSTRARILKRIEALTVKIKANRPESKATDARATVAALDLQTWGRKYLPAYYTSASPRAHAELLERLARGTSRRHMREVIVGSRGTAKSFVVSLLYVLACAVHGAEPYILLASEAAEQANLLLEAVKVELEENERLAADYPNACGRGPVWRVNGIVTANGTKIEAVGSGKKLRGRRKKQTRPSLVVLDDAEGDDHASSSPMRETSARWFNGTIMKIGDGSTNFVVVANAIHRDSLAMTLLTRPSWSGHVWRSIVNYPERMDLWSAWENLYRDPKPESAKEAAEFYKANRREMERGAVLFWPNRDGERLLDLMKSRAEDRTSFEAEKQCNPINPSLCEWGDSYFSGLVYFKRWPKDLELRTLALDPSKGKDSKRGDYSALVMLGRDAKGQMWVRADLKRRDSRAIAVDAVSAYLDFEPDAAGCESNGFQELLRPDIEQEAESRGRDVVFQPIENSVNKRVRIRRLTPYLSRGRFNFYDDPGTRLLVDQLREFPIGTHDDAPDALEMALRIAVDVFNSTRVEHSSNSALSFDVDG